jgi:hypothetical protein
MVLVQDWHEAQEWAGLAWVQDDVRRNNDARMA